MRFNEAIEQQSIISFNTTTQASFLLLAQLSVAKLHSPAGLDIGAETPEEIAVSIVAQMVEIRRKAESAEETQG